MPPTSFQHSGRASCMGAAVPRTSCPPPGSAAFLMELPPSQARRRPPAAGRKQRHGAAACRTASAGMGTLLTAAAVTLLGSGRAGAVHGCAGLLSTSRCRRTCGMRCRGGWGNVGWGKADAPGLGAATIATKISSIQACPWQPASQPAVEQQGTWAVQLQATTSQQWAHRPAQAAVAGAGEVWGRAWAGGGPHAWPLQQERG